MKYDHLNFHFLDDTTFSKLCYFGNDQIIDDGPNNSSWGIRETGKTFERFCHPKMFNFQVILQMHSHLFHVTLWSSVEIELSTVGAMIICCSLNHLCEFVFRCLMLYGIGVFESDNDEYTDNVHLAL